MTQPPFGEPPTLRVLLTGATPYGGSAHSDVYAALAHDWPPLVSGNRAALLASVGGSRAMAELLRSAWRAAAAAMGAKGQARRAAEGLFHEQLLVLWQELGRLLDLRRGVDVEYDWTLGLVDPLDDLRGRMAVLLAALGDREATDALIALVWQHARRASLGRDAGDLLAVATGASLMEGAAEMRWGAELVDVVAQWREHGRQALGMSAPARPEARPAPAKGSPLRRIEEARAEASPPAGSAVLFPSSILAGVGKADNEKELKRILKDVLDRPLPGVRVPADWDSWERALIAKHPNAAAFIRAVRASQGAREFWGHAVVCADGPPGTGKSALCRSIAQASGLPFKRFQCENASDNSYGGTPIRWASSHQDFVTGALVEFGTRTFAACLDEIEKAAGSRDSNSGRMHDVLHGHWDRETAARWNSPFLCHEIDLTGVLFLCTSNDASSLPQSLRDRMTTVRVEEPTAEHLGSLAPQVARDVCRDMGLDPAWGSLDGVEWEALRQAWGAGGSIRRLQHLVATILRARDADPSLLRH